MTYSEDKRRRVEQFAEYLRLMHDRAFDEVGNCCYITFEERRRRGTPGGRKLSEEEKAAQEVARQSRDAGIDGAGGPDESAAMSLPDEGWRQDDSKNRFVQFSIEHDWFCVDLPRQTLHRAEAGQILRCRQGFFYLRDRPEFALYGENVEKYDPFRKIYTYGDEESPAEDMAYILFDLWHFPVESKFYVTAASFNGKFCWEQGLAIQ
jgi:hypothetical protein